MYGCMDEWIDGLMMAVWMDEESQIHSYVTGYTDGLMMDVWMYG